MIDNLKDFHAKLTTPQAAAFVGLGISSLEKLRVTGGGPAFLKIGRRVVYDAVDLEHWLVKHKRSSTSEIRAADGPLLKNIGAPADAGAGPSS